MWQTRFWGRRRKFKTPKPRKITLSERGLYEPVTLEKDVVKEIVTLLWANGCPVFIARERIPVCQYCGADICQPSEAGHPDLHGWIPGPKINQLAPQPFYIECKRPQGGVESYVQKEFIARAQRDGVLAFFARSWDDVKREFFQRGIALKGG